MRRQTYVGEPCVLVNRTCNPLTVQKDGITKIFQPGDNISTTDWIRFAKQQHPRLGTAGPSGLDGESLIGVRGFPGEKLDLIPPGQEHKGIEIFDRSHPDFDPSERDVVHVPTGIRPPVKRGTGAELPHGVMFTERENMTGVDTGPLKLGD